MTELVFHLPFPLQALPPRHENSIRFPWLVIAADGSVTRELIETAVVIEHVQASPSPVMEAAGWHEHRVGAGARVTYGGDAHGGFSSTRWRVSVPTAKLVGVGFAPDIGIFAHLAGLVNNFIDMHTALTLTLWTPRATPRDIVDLKYTVRGSDGVPRGGQLLSFDNDAPLRAAMAPIAEGEHPLVGEAQRCFGTPWGACVLDGLRELMALRTVRAATLAALGFELFLNGVLLQHGDQAKAERATLAMKGQVLLAPIIGGALNSKVHGKHAEAWLRVLHGRNSLMHRQQHAFEWTTLDQKTARMDVFRLEDCVEFLGAVLSLVRYVQLKIAPAPVTA